PVFADDATGLPNEYHGATWTVFWSACIVHSVVPCLTRAVMMARAVVADVTRPRSSASAASREGGEGRRLTGILRASCAGQPAEHATGRLPDEFARGGAVGILLAGPGSWGREAPCILTSPILCIKIHPCGRRSPSR